MDSPEYIIRKYNELIPRSFKTKLDIFLFYKCITKGDLQSITKQEFEHFKIDQKIVNKYQKAWQLEENQSLEKEGIKMKEVDNLIEIWNKENLILKEDLFNNHKVLFISDYFPFSEFERIYNRDPNKRICHYCKATDYSLRKLREEGKIFTKQLRGYSMEIDRLKPNYEYTSGNVVLACYWCNNAKSDEFSEEEFIDYIGHGIRKVWEKRDSNSSDNLY